MPRLLITLTLAATLATAATAAAQIAEPPPLPTQPPDPPPSGYGTLEVREVLDKKAGPVGEGWTAYVVLRRAKTGKQLLETTLPLEISLARGSYRITAYRRVGAPGADPTALAPPSGFCSGKLELRKGNRNKVTVVRSGDRCRVSFGEGKPKRRCKGSGAKRRCTKVKKKEKPKGPTAPPPCCKPLPTLRISPFDHDFGSVQVGLSSAPVAYTVENISTVDRGPLTIELDDDTGSFEISADLCAGETLAAQEECTFDLSFAPTAEGFMSAGLLPTYPGGNGGVGVGVKGTGVP
jgi:hypothetical protein